jgi:hypothetical protein
LSTSFWFLCISAGVLPRFLLLLYNTKDLATTLGHETSHAIDNQDPSIDTNPQNNASKADNEIYAQNYGDDFSDYVEFASENYGDGSLADSNNKNLGNTPAEIQRNQKLSRVFSVALGKCS